MKAVIYTRVSTAEQADQGTSLVTQEQICRAWCVSHGYQVAALFSDAGESAKTADRPQFAALLNWCGKHRPDAVVVWDFTRWARNTDDHVIACAALAKHSIKLFSATEETADSPSGRFLRTILAGKAQLDNEERSERARTAMRETARRGGWCTYAPYGFKSARSATLPILVECPQQAGIVREMFNGLADGRRTLFQTITFAHEAGINEKSARKMLRNPVYAGIIRSALTNNQDVEAVFPGLVSLDTWRRAQAAMDGKKQGARKPRPEWPLRGMLHCPDCSRSITACLCKGHGGTYAYYQCAGGHVRARVEPVHAAFLSLLSSMRDKFLPLMAEIRAKVRVRITERMAAMRKVESQATAEAQRLRQRRARLLEAFLSGALDKAEFQVKDGNLAGQIETAIVLTQHKTDWGFSIENTISKCVALLDDPVAIWQSLDLHGRRRFIVAMFEGDLYLTANGTIQTHETHGITGTLRELTHATGDMARLTRLCVNLNSLLEQAGVAA
jgi:DNA invertase Pin-like site-specific DNA recombinase